MKLCLAAGFAFFLLIEGMVLWGMGQTLPDDLDYVMVLGAGLNGERPSHTLELRLERALAYIETHPDTKILVTGGFHASVSVTEAQAMENWLLEKGVDPDRILTENRSTTTEENMQFSFPILLEDAGQRRAFCRDRHQRFPYLPFSLPGLPRSPPEHRTG